MSTVPEDEVAHGRDTKQLMNRLRFITHVDVRDMKLLMIHVHVTDMSPFVTPFVIHVHGRKTHV